MSEEIEIAKEWLTKYYESAKAGRTCAYTLKEYIIELEAERDELRDLIWWLEPNCPSIEGYLEQMRKEKREDALEEPNRESNSD